MPRLKFDLQPEGPWRSGQNVEEHNATTVEFCARYDWMPTPSPCDCGQYVDGMFCTCRPEERARKTPARVAKILEANARRRHLEGLAEKRKFPPLPRCPMGTCYWCRAPIVHGQAKQRSMHDGRKDEPSCRWEYALRTDLATQQAHLLKRDGPGCASCGAVIGRWGLVWNCSEYRAEEYGYAGATSVIHWSTGLEVDHFIPLAAAWEAFPDPERRRWFFSPAQLQLLCPAGGCHAAKTREDIAFIKACQANGQEWAKAEVLRRLSDAGLLRPARPKGAT